jgi:hypothetical protein
MKRSMALVVSLLAACGSSTPTKPVEHVESHAPAEQPMPQTPELQAIRNDNIQYATYTPPGDRGKAPPSLYRQLSVTAPPEAFELTRSGDARAFDVLVPMLDDPERNWAAVVMLAALTGHDASIVIAFENAEGFKGTVGEHDARKNWESWLAEHRAKLQWDAERHQFRVE